MTDHYRLLGGPGSPYSLKMPAPPEGFFRYVALPRVVAYVAIGWQIIGETRCPHDGARAAIVEWPAADEPLEPNEDCALAHAVRTSAPRC